MHAADVSLALSCHAAHVIVHSCEGCIGLSVAYGVTKSSPHEREHQVSLSSGVSGP